MVILEKSGQMSQELSFLFMIVKKTPKNQARIKKKQDNNLVLYNMKLMFWVLKDPEG